MINDTFLTMIGNITTFIDTNVTNKHVYFYIVRAVNDAGEGLMSNEISILVKETGQNNPAPQSPSNMPSGYTIQIIIYIFIGIGSVMIVSTFTIARRIKIKHSLATSASHAVLASMRHLLDAAASTQATNDAFLPVIASALHKDLSRYMHIFTVAAPEITSEIIDTMAIMNDDSEVNLGHEGAILSVHQTDLCKTTNHAAKDKTESFAIWCQTCDNHDDARIIIFNEEISYHCKKCGEPMVVDITCPACFEHITMNQEDVHLIYEDGMRCPVCHEIC